MTVNPRRALIIGGGVAGPVLALFLKRSGFDARVFEASSGPADTKLLACMPSGDPARHGQAPVMITRAALHRVLVDRAENQEISVSYNKRLVTIDDLPNLSIVAHFADGSAAEDDFIVGADGIRSQVRQAVMPEAPKPVYFAA
jgi:2-polyprenyl-6-methoxyphenol hydroxylase-like FAD-dependent oxidoreductase